LKWVLLTNFFFNLGEVIIFGKKGTRTITKRGSFGKMGKTIKKNRRREGHFDQLSRKYYPYYLKLKNKTGKTLIEGKQKKVDFGMKRLC
jgi:hypothetical protein